MKNKETRDIASLTPIRLSEEAIKRNIGNATTEIRRLRIEIESWTALLHSGVECQPILNRMIATNRNLIDSHRRLRSMMEDRLATLDIIDTATATLFSDSIRMFTSVENAIACIGGAWFGIVKIFS